MTQQKKKPLLASLLSFLLPGAGLAYLGKWKWAAINLAVVLFVGVLAVCLLSDESFETYRRYIAVGCSAGSAGLAQGIAKMMNDKIEKGDGT